LVIPLEAWGGVETPLIIADKIEEFPDEERERDTARFDILRNMFEA